MKYRLGILATHPIQYFSPWYQALAAHPSIDLTVYYAQRQTPQGQAAAGFGVPFEWDRPLLDGYSHQFLKNRAARPNTDNFSGCDIPEIAEIIAKTGFDAFLVSGWYSRGYWQAMRACWMAQIPVLVRSDSQLSAMDNPLKRMAKYPFYRLLMSKFDGYLAVGRRSAEYFRHYGAPEERIFHVPHAVDNAFFEQSTATHRREREALRQQWGLPADGTVFMFAGKLLARKRPMDFVQAIGAAAAQGKRLAGLAVGDGPLRAALQERARALRAPISFTGFLNQGEIGKAYAASDALVLPSEKSETWGLVVNEAMAGGLPAVVSDEVGCGPDLVEPGMTGQIFKCGNWEALGAILKQLAQHPAEISRMGESARRRIADYSTERAVEGTVEALDGIVKRR